MVTCSEASKTLPSGSKRVKGSPVHSFSSSSIRGNICLPHSMLTELIQVIILSSETGGIAGAKEVDCGTALVPLRSAILVILTPYSHTWRYFIIARHHSRCECRG